MPAYGYDYMTHGALAPFMMSSVLGGTLSLLPNPDKDGWLTWGFDPYSAGDDQYQQTAEITTGAAIMRVPTKYVEGDGDGFAAYLAESAARCHEALQFYVNGLDVEIVKDPEFAKRMGQAVTQLGNVMQAIDILNSAMAQSGLQPMRPRFGNRFKAKTVTVGGEVITQASITDFIVVDLWTGETVGTNYGTLDAAVYEARKMNDKSRDKWIKQQITDMVLPEWVESLATAGVINNPEREIQDYLIEHGFKAGDVLTEALLHDTINYLWRRPTMLLQETTSVYMAAVLGETADEDQQPQPVDVKLQVAYTDKDAEEFFGELSLEVTTDADWLTAEMDEEQTITVRADIGNIEDPGLYNGSVTIREANDKTSNTITLPVTLSVAGPPVPALPDGPPEEPVVAPVIEPGTPLTDITVPDGDPAQIHTTFPVPPPMPDFEQEVDEG